MKGIRTLLVAGLVLGISSVVAAQEPEREKPAEPEAPKAAPAPRAEHPAPATRQEEPKPEKQDRQEEKPQKQENDRGAKEAARPDHEEKGAKEQTARGGPSGRGAHIPDPKFKANFGRQHSFAVNRVITQRTVVVNQTQFVYGGYTFMFADPWPADWAYTDDCYIDYVNDEYVLVDLAHPGMFLTLIVIS